MASSEITQLTWLVLAGVAAPVLARAMGRLAVPGVVLEIALGVVLGPQVLHRVSTGGLVTAFADLGLGLLMFLAGLELDLARLRGRPIVLGAASWASSVVVGAAVAAVLLVAGHRHGEVVIGLSVTTTALGTLLPIVRDAGMLQTPLGRYVLAVGSVGEFGPIVLVALLLAGDQPAVTAALLIGFGALAAGFAYAASRPWGRRIAPALRVGLHSSSQLPVRVSMLLIVLLVVLATRLGLDVLLGAFAAGIVVRVAITGQESHEDTVVFREKLEAIGFGVFVPVFFIVSGTRLDLGAVVRHPVSLLAIPLFLGLLLLARGMPTLWWFRGVLPRRERTALALWSATGLPLIVVITTIGTANGYVASQTAAALVTAGVLSVLVLPAAALALLGRGPAGTGDG